ncbi:hypothetical protein J6590_029211 [Homalodisca vitripennis]|nr:hypothetical protein J6590_029211 [Homalodisca vitripennis]
MAIVGRVRLQQPQAGPTVAVSDSAVSQNSSPSRITSPPFIAAARQIWRAPDKIFGQAPPPRPHYTVSPPPPPTAAISVTTSYYFVSNRKIL